MRLNFRKALALSCAALAIGSALGCGLSVLPAADAAALAGTRAQAVEAKPAGYRQSWLEGAVIYGLVPPLCGEAPFDDVVKRLDYLKELGVDAVWLSPVNSTDDPSAISYAITDYLGVREDFGTSADFKRVVAEAHRRGIKVLVDFVPNHTSTGHRFYQQAQAKGPQSPFWNYYVRDEQGNAQHYFDWENLKNLNYDNPAVQAMMVEAFTYWVREMGVDGFRVDAAWGIKDRTPAFWPKLNQALRAIKPDVFMLAEASARDPYYVKSGFDAAYDWTHDLGKWSWEKAWEHPERAGDQLRTALAGRETPPDRIARFLNNNDTGQRFVTKYGLPTQRVAAVLLHTLPGIPIVYMGEETAAEFDPYEDPPPVSTADRHKLRPLYKKLATLRETMPALRKGSWTPLTPAKKAPGVYAFARQSGKDLAVVVLNFGKATDVSLALPATLKRATGQRWSDALTGRAVPVAGATTLDLAIGASTAYLLTPGTAPDR